MSRRLIALNPDLQRLADEGYDLVLVGGHLVIRRVPYLTAARTVAYGSLIAVLDMTGERTDKPHKHVCFWQGEMPHGSNGQPIDSMFNPSARQNLGHGLTDVLTLSAKTSYRDYHHKMTTYIGRITPEAQDIDPSVTAQVFPRIETSDEPASVFEYLDTASSRAGIGALNAVFENQSVAIVGLGGTGSYLLDLVAKTRVREIHLFDGDVLSSHNAFRAPGAISLDELRERPKKVDHWAQHYARMRRGIIPHADFLRAANVHQLPELGVDFVFLAIDAGPDKRAIVDALEAAECPFIDVGLGVLRGPAGLSGAFTVVTSVAGRRDAARERMSFVGDDEDNEYSTNIQIAELNAMNATFAVLRWKKLMGFYRDSTREHFTCFAMAPNSLVNEDCG
jgi:hypothetical protein